jgi:D-alanyl-D-alanine carboxypeptidase/D-alanyl-D-alanine-endopeptidase (penicillin-binding protein 4)
MKKYILFFFLFCLSEIIFAQSLSERLNGATNVLLADQSMRHAWLAVFAIDADSGDTLIGYNAQKGMPPASCLKIITGATAFELLGPSHCFSTGFLTEGTLKNGVLDGNIYIDGNGDPSLGSHRFFSTLPEQQLMLWRNILQREGILRIKGKIIPFKNGWKGIPTPGGYTWNDIGNYYGAGSDYLNWRENQYNLILQSGPRIGDKVDIISTIPAPLDVTFEVNARAAEKGTGDRTNIYLSPKSTYAILEGTIPREEKKFIIAGSLPDPPAQLVHEMTNAFRANGLPIDEQVKSSRLPPYLQPLFIHYSPSLDSLHYWFMKKSVNLYGEAFIRAIAKQDSGDGTLEQGIERVIQFWEKRGIDPASLTILDGSGLSPQNRVTPAALVRVLQYARRQWWFPPYLQAFPQYNGMSLKSGTIGGVKSFAGYHTTPDGKNVILAILVNNYDGSSAAIVNKLFTWLDEFKK